VENLTPKSTVHCTYHTHPTTPPLHVLTFILDSSRTYPTKSALRSFSTSSASLGPSGTFYTCYSATA